MRGSGTFVQGIGNAKLDMALVLLDGVVLRVGLSGFSESSSGGASTALF